ncbi:MAG: hypothetical protein KHX93_02620 [Actinomyces sp. oral taxon 181]|nr:hypothetical protein [Actinomyces sp. oral taxon 181]
MNPLTFEQIVAAVSFLGMVLTLINGAKAMNRASQEDAMRLVRIEEGVKQLKSDLDDTQKAFAAYMARTDETIVSIRDTLSVHDTRLAVVEDVTRNQAGRLERLEQAHTH